MIDRSLNTLPLTKRLILLQKFSEQYNIVKFNRKDMVKLMTIGVYKHGAFQKRLNTLNRLISEDFAIYSGKDGFVVFKIHLN